MHITETGWVLIPLSLLLFLFSSQWLFLSMVFFLPFSATAVVNFDLGGTIQGYGLQPYQLMTVLFLLREGPKLLAGRNDLKISHPLGLSLALLFIFVGIVVLSLIMPFIINGRISIMDYSLKQYVPHIFTAHHVTQTLLVIFGAVITAVTASFNNTTDRILLTFRAYVLSGVFVGLWGFLQLIFYHLNIPYPDFIFNNSMSEAARNFGGVLEDVGMKRVSSVAVEPSIFAQFLLTVIPFILYAIITRKKIISHAIDKLILILLSTILLLSTSTAGSVGFIVMCFLFLLLGLHFKLFNLRNAGILFALFTGWIYAYFISSAGNAYTRNYVLLKHTTGSGIERISMFKASWDYFLQYPVLGVGWGSVDSSDLIAGLLANTGILGLLAFVVFVFYIFLRLIKMLASSKPVDAFKPSNIHQWSTSLLVSLITLLFTNAVTGFAYVFGHFWFILGMAIALLTISSASLHYYSLFGEHMIKQRR